MPNRRTTDAVKAFADDIMPQLTRDLQPYKFLYELYKNWQFEKHPDMPVIGRNSFVQAINSLAGSGDIKGWTSTETTHVRPDGMLDAPEPIMTRYGVDAEPGIASTYYGLLRDTAPCAKELKDKAAADTGHFKPFTLEMI